MNIKKKKHLEEIHDKKYSRRDFLIAGGSLIAGGFLTSYASSEALTGKTGTKNKYPKSKGYLAYDSQQCSGCQSCMIACSLVHEGSVCISLSRIQITRAVSDAFPDDIRAYTCQQCPEPACVQECPAGACYINMEKGNVRMINPDKCIGCGTCINACPYIPHRIIWNPDKNKALKCDLCSNAKYFDKEGGPSGVQACVETCPHEALKFVSKPPV